MEPKSFKVECEGCGKKYSPKLLTGLQTIAMDWSLRNPGKIFKASVRDPQGWVNCPHCYPKELLKDLEMYSPTKKDEDYDDSDVEVILDPVVTPKMAIVGNYIKAINEEKKKADGKYREFLNKVSTFISEGQKVTFDEEGIF